MKISNSMPSSPSKPNELKFGMWGFYHQPNNLRGWWVKFKKKLFLNNPNVYSPETVMFHVERKSTNSASLNFMDRTDVD